MEFWLFVLQHISWLVLMKAAVALLSFTHFILWGEECRCVYSTPPTPALSARCSSVFRAVHV